MTTKETIRAAFVKHGGGIELRTLPKPMLEKGSLLVQMRASGICGTDLEKLTGKNITSSILGHEVSGIVTESQSGEFSSGDRVVPHHHVACNECELCSVGAQTMCEKFKNSNFVPGGFADEFLVPAYNVSHGGVHKMGNTLSFEEASFAEPIGCCIRGLKKATTKDSRQRALSKVLVVGAGPIGLMHMELLRFYYPAIELVAVDMMQSRLDFASSVENAQPIDGSKFWQGEFSTEALRISAQGFDLVVIATGSSPAFGEALKCVRKSGTVLLFGAPHKGSTHNLNLTSFFLGEATITSSYSTTETELTEAINLLESGKLKVKKFISSIFPLSKVEDAFSVARSANQIKVLVTP